MLFFLQYKYQLLTNNVNNSLGCGPSFLNNTNSLFVELQINGFIAKINVYKSISIKMSKSFRYSIYGFHIVAV